MRAAGTDRNRGHTSISQRQVPVHEIPAGITREGRLRDPSCCRAEPTTGPRRITREHPPAGRGPRARAGVGESTWTHFRGLDIITAWACPLWAGHRASGSMATAVLGSPGDQVTLASSLTRLQRGGFGDAPVSGCSVRGQGAWVKCGDLG